MTPFDTAGTTRVACLQLSNPADETADARFARVMSDVDQVAPSADLVVLPELWWTGYFAFDRYAAEARHLSDEVFAELGRISARHGIHLVAGTFVERRADGLANCAVVFGPDGEMVHTYRKIHLFGYASREAELLVPGESATVADTSLGGLATTTCYDLRFPELYRLLVDRGARLIIIPAAWPAARLQHWRILLQARAVENQAFVIACNGAGAQEGVELAGHSMIVDPWGTIIAEAGDGGQTLRGDIQLSQVDEVRTEFPVLTHRRLEVMPQITRGPAAQPAG